MYKRFLHFLNCLLCFSFLCISCDFNFRNAIEYDSLSKKAKLEEDKKTEVEEVAETKIEEVKEKDLSEDDIKEKTEAKKERLWSILIYMAADNNLEYSAMEDIYEMECSKLNTDEISVFFLLDRSDDFDTSNDNWTGSRLYQLKTGRKLNNSELISQEIDCSYLGLKENISTELDMSSSYVLADSLAYINETYPAKNMGLIMWGHGTGWRSSNELSDENNNYKGFAHDDSSCSYMTLKQFGDGIKNGLNGQKLDLLGLDTCFGGEIEVMYELRNMSDYAVGTEGLLLMSGWNYKKIFDSFESEEQKTAENFVKNIVKQFSNEYSQSHYASIVGIDMSLMDEYFTTFDNVMKIAADNIKTRNDRDKLANILFSKGKNETLLYSYGKKNSDVYLDINSVFDKFISLYSGNEEIKKSIKKFNDIKNKCVIANWASGDSTGGLGVYYGTLTAGNFISSVHPSSYIKEKTPQQIQFVEDSIGYVPTTDKNKSLLDKLFYCSFN